MVPGVIKTSLYVKIIDYRYVKYFHTIHMEVKKQDLLISKDMTIN
jgi:hypothetical protein